MSETWDPNQYLQFENARLRPAIELLSQVNLSDPKRVVDLGCGPATSTRLLGERFNRAKIIGIDKSEAMLAKARDKYPAAEYICADAAKWSAQHSADLIFANAVFHWLPDHPQLFSNLANSLNDGGVLAFQMPDNMDEPSHLAISRMVSKPKWRTPLGGSKKPRTKLAKTEQYYNWLTADFDQINLWHTNYLQVMEAPNKIVEWVKGAALTPYLKLLNEKQQRDFLAEYLEEIVANYPTQADGKVIYHFPRFFAVARKRA